jgi:hypothetical protein
VVEIWKLAAPQWNCTAGMILSPRSKKYEVKVDLQMFVEVHTPLTVPDLAIQISSEAWVNIRTMTFNAKSVGSLEQKKKDIEPKNLSR